MGLPDRTLTSFEDIIKLRRSMKIRRWKYDV